MAISEYYLHNSNDPGKAPQSTTVYSPGPFTDSIKL